MKLLAIVCITLAFTIVYCVEADWEGYKKTHNKNYDAVEDAKRKEIYLHNVKEVNEHNKLYDQGKVTFTKGVNQFSDWTPEELMRLHGARPPSGAAPPPDSKESSEEDDD